MAPPQAAAKALQGHKPRPSTSKPIVPAIPFQYMQKRKQNVAAAPKKVEDNKSATPTTLTPVPSSPATPATVATEASPKPVIESPKVAAEAPEIVKTSGDEAADSAGGSDGPATPMTLPTEAAKDVANVDEPKEALAEEEPQDSSALVTSDNQSTETRSTYNMPPPFVPANGYAVADNSKQRNFGPISGQQSMHHAHPSTGSMVFGGYAESNGSSPAPPLSGGMQFPPQDGGRIMQHQYTNGPMHQFPNGLPMGMPPHGQFPRQDNFQVQNGPENFARRQMTGYGPPDNYSPTTGTPGMDWPRHPVHDPSNPHSFHGSQSSAPNEQDGSGPSLYNAPANPLPAPNGPGGPNGYNEDMHLYQSIPARPKQRTGSQGVYPGQVQFQTGFHGPTDDLDGLLAYLQSQFGNPQFSDYTLELRYSDDRASPVRLPGHNLIFARSPTLKKLMAAQISQPTGDNMALRTLFIETDDRFLRSDAFQMAIGRLYGAPLLSQIVPLGPNQGTSNAAGTLPERFDFAIGYAAAGYLLQMPPVVNRGIDTACGLINMQTVERALDFALDGGLDNQWVMDGHPSSYSRAKYGPEVNALVHAALAAVITTFPPNFELVTTVPDTVHNRRIPFIPSHRPTPSSRFSGIKFGDHTRADSVSPTPATDAATPTSIISKILVNLPFILLKYVLESPRLGNVSGWATTTLRQKAMHAVIEEREKRRLKALNSRAVSNADREANDREWNEVGWKESVGTVGPNNETTVLNREWVGYVLKGN